jgi:hypothetical protein
MFHSFTLARMIYDEKLQNAAKARNSAQGSKQSGQPLRNALANVLFRLARRLEVASHAKEHT